MPKYESKREQELITICERLGKPYEDDEFPATLRSLYKNPRQPPPDAPDVNEWLRPSEISSSPQLFVEGTAAGDVVQGALGDCWFLGALSVAATREDLLRTIFVASHPEYGFYQIKFYKDGDWITVTIDDRLPCGKNRKPVFAHCKDENELWVALVEKAYAKLHGCYELLDGGSTAQALCDILGENTEKMEFQDKETQELIKSGRMWKLLKKFTEEGFMMGCSLSTTTGGSEEDNGMGILQNHAYGVIKIEEVEGHQLLQIRNPWGLHEWKGPWCDGDKRWTQAILTKLSYEFADDGMFWMVLDDFVQNFNKMYICRIYTDEVGEVWTKHVIKGEWKGASAGGCINHPSWRDNPQYALSTKTPDTQIFASLMQPDARLQGSTKYDAHIGFYVMKAENTLRKKMTVYKGDIIGRVDFTNSREVSVEVTIEPDNAYVLIPCTFQPGCKSPYILTLYTEHDVEIKEIQPAKATSLDSEWNQRTAGGCFNFPSWRNNPQFLLTVKDPKCDMTIVLQQPEPLRGQEVKFIGFYICKGRGRQRKIVMSDVVGKSKFMNSLKVSCDFSLEGSDEPYVIIPCTFHPGHKNLFTLSVYTNNTIQLEEVSSKADWIEKQIGGQWEGPTAGGCQNHPTWVNNPYFRLALQSPANVVVLLTQPEAEKLVGIGFYVAVEKDGLLSNRDVVGKSDFVCAREVTVSFVQVPGRNYIIVPATFEPGIEATFDLTVFSSAAFDLESV